jgi:hypothetical protein
VAEAGSAPDADATVPDPAVAPRNGPRDLPPAGPYGWQAVAAGRWPACQNQEETPVPAPNWYLIIAVVAIVIGLTYLFGRGTPPVTTTPPPTTGTTK